jgi:hypothetical protein
MFIIVISLFWLSNLPYKNGVLLSTFLPFDVYQQLQYTSLIMLLSIITIVHAVVCNNIQCITPFLLA